MQRKERSIQKSKTKSERRRGLSDLSFYLSSLCRFLLYALSISMTNGPWGNNSFFAHRLICTQSKKYERGRRGRKKRETTTVRSRLSVIRPSVLDLIKTFRVAPPSPSLCLRFCNICWIGKTMAYWVPSSFSVVCVQIHGGGYLLECFLAVWHTPHRGA